MAFIRNVDKLIEGLENKFFTEARAKAALAPELAAEESARQAGDAAEAAARQAADNSLDARLDVIEGSGEGSVAKAEQDAKDYADQKVAALVNSAPEVLDTLKELSDALGGDANFATSVANQIGSVDAKVDQEILDRASAVSAEQSARESADQALDGRLDVLEQDPTTKSYVDGEVLDLQGQITQEISDRQAAVSSEQSARQLADSNLSGRITVLEQDPTTKTYVDGQVSSLDGRLDIIEGADSVEGSVAKAEKDAKDYADSLNSAMDSRVDVLEQDPTTKSYVDGEILDLQGQIDAEQLRAELAEQGLDGRLDILEQDPTTKAYVDQEVSAEESRAMSAESALDGRLDILEQDPTTKSYVDGEVSNLQGQVNTEKGRIDAILSASSADKDSFAEIVSLINSVDASNDSAFAGYVLSNDAALAQEISDRQSADTTLQSNIDAEVAARSAEDLTMFKKDGSRQLTGNVLFSAETFDIGTSGANRPNNVFIKSILSAGTKVESPILVGSNSASGSLELQSTSNSTKGWVKIPNGDSFILGGQTANILAAGLTPASGTTQALMVMAGTSTGITQYCVSTSNQPGISLIKTNDLTNPGFFADNTTLGSMVLRVFNGSVASSIQVMSFGGRVEQDGGHSLNSLGSRMMFNSTHSGTTKPAERLRLDSFGNISLIKDTSTSIEYNQNLLWQKASNGSRAIPNDGGGDIGSPDNGVTMARPNNVYVKTNVEFGGGMKVGFVTKSADYTLVSSNYVVSVSDLSVSRVMTLPSAATMGAGKVFIIKDRSGAASQTNYIQIAPQSGEQIDGQSDYKVVMPYESVMLVSDGSNWFII